MSRELRRLVNKYQFADAADIPWGSTRKETVTYDVMAEILSLSKVY